MAKGFKKRYFSLAAITATVSMVTLSAQAASVEAIQKVVVSADKSEKSVEEVTDDVTVITAEEIAERGWESLDEALREAVGLDIVQTGGYGQPASLYLQGLNPNQTLILIDGIRYNDPTNLNGAALELIDLDNIERIEIIRGPQSGVWGADAVAGVINIVTKRPKIGISGGWKVEGGSFTTLKTSANIYKASKTGYFGVALERYHTKGFSAYSAKPGDKLYGTNASDLPLEDDGYDNRRIDIKAGTTVGGALLSAQFIKLNATVHYDNFGADAPDSPYTINKIDDTFMKLGLAKKIASNDLKLHYNYSNFQRSQYGGYEGSVRELEVADKIDYGLGKMQIGLGWQRFYQKKSAGVLTKDGYQNRYFFATNSNTFGDLLLSQALRYDRYDKFKNKFTYKLGAKYTFYKDFFMSANVATGYKAPSIFQLGYNATNGLQPEKSIGYNLTLGNAFVSVTYFDNRVKDLITYVDPDNDWNTPNDYYYNASGTSKFRGYEVRAHKDFFDQFYMQLGYTYLSAKDAAGNRLPRRAKQKFTYSLSWYPTNEHTININGYYVGERKDTDGSKIGKYNVTNLILSHNFAKHITGFVKINNLFNRFYQEVAGYTTPDRSYYIGLRASY